MYPEFSAKFERKNLDFDKHFNNAFNNCNSKNDETFKDEIIKVLKQILNEYGGSQSTTKQGSFWRKVARVISIILPFIKLKNNANEIKP